MNFKGLKSSESCTVYLLALFSFFILKHFKAILQLPSCSLPFSASPCLSGSISTTHTSKHWNAKTTLALCTDLGLTFKQNTL